jgi:hypothetical protein
VQLKCYKAKDREDSQKIAEDTDKLGEPEQADGSYLQYVAKSQMWRWTGHARETLGGLSPS